MTHGDGKGRPGGSCLGAGEDTLRLIAGLPAPEGLEKRVRERLRGTAGHATGYASESAQVAKGQGRVLAWRGGERELGGATLEQRVGWMRGAAAAAIVCVVAGGCWGVYARVQPGQAAHAVPAPHGAMSGSGAGEFSNAKAMRTPQTLNAPVIPQPAAAVPVVEKTQTPGVQSQAMRGHGDGTGTAPSTAVPAPGRRTEAETLGAPEGK